MNKVEEEKYATFVGTTIGFAVAFAFFAIAFSIKSRQYEELQDELVERGYKEWVVDNKGNADLQWTEEKEEK